MSGERSGAVRLDAWLWAVRVYKSRSAATAACKGGHVQVAGERAKPATPVRPGMRVRVRKGERELDLEVRQLLAKRVSAPLAAAAYTDHSPPPPPRVERVVVAVRERGAGRPTKRERRQIDRLRGRE